MKKQDISSTLEAPLQSLPVTNLSVVIPIPRLKVSIIVPVFELPINGIISMYSFVSGFFHLML